ncbi:MAG: hypothetical protein [Bacteriophage sp.]|nr:MAG: hypothetical protein [Bacteriophage sp.]
MNLIMSCKAKCIEIKKKSKAAGFVHLQVGDIMEFRVLLDGVGQRSGGSSYAVDITYTNERTGEQGKKTFNQLGKIIRGFVFKQIEKGED